MPFDLDSYEPVASRIQRFYEAYPNGAIHTDIVFDDGTRVVIKASVWRDITDPMPAGVDYAEELLTDKGVNATSRIENAATSAAGRAVSIAAAGLAPSDWTKKATREEMSKVERRGSAPASTAVQGDPPSEAQIRAIRAITKAMGRTVPPIHGWTKRDASQYIDKLKKEQEGSASAPQDDEEPF